MHQAYKRVESEVMVDRDLTCSLINLLIFRAQPNQRELSFSHTQLRNYISTVDPDRIYVVVERNHVQRPDSAAQMG
jgi:hypothetical protein